MSTVELKNRLKEKIEKLDQDYLLEHLIEIIEIENSEDLFEIPKSHKKSIDIGLSQIGSGLTLSNEEVLTRVQKWADK